MRLDFDWDFAKATSNAAKHGVTFDEAMLVFHDPLALTILDQDHGHAEERWVTLGQTPAGNLLVVVHTWIDANPERVLVRIISARPPTRAEARQYREDPIP